MLSTSPRLTLFAVFLCFCTNAFVRAQDVLDGRMPAAGLATGNITTVHRDIMAVQGNQAGLGFAGEAQLYASAESRFGVQGLNYFSAAAMYPSQWGGLGFSVQYYGVDQYRESLLGLAYGKRIMTNMAIGVKFDHLTVRIPSYGKKSTIMVELGILSSIGDKVWVGFHFLNPFEIKFIEEEAISRIIALGVRYDLSDRTYLAMEIEKSSYLDANIKVGMEYDVMERLALRIGINTHPALITFGIGYRMEHGLQMDFGSSVHQVLGISPAGGIGYSFVNQNP